MFPLCLILQVLFIALAVLVGQCDFGINTRYLYQVAPLSHFLRSTFFFFSVHTILVWPITQFVTREVEGLKSASLRRLLFVALVSVPLLSFGYYLGTFKTALDYFELFLLVVPQAVVGVHFYEESGKSWTFSLYLTLAVYFGFFLFGDLLGPFVTLFRYAPSHQSFLVWRILGPLSSVLLTTLFLKNTKRELFEESFALLVLLVLSIFTRFGISSNVELVGEKFFFWSLLFPVIFCFLRLRNAKSYQWALYTSALCALGILFDAGLLLSRFEAKMNFVIWLALALSSLVALGSLLFKLRDKSIRIFFAISPINS